VRVIDKNGQLDLSFTVANDFNGFEILDRKLKKIKSSKIGFELPHGPLVD